MKRLLLMRHAKTENWYQGTDDEGRALVPRGWADARLIGDALVSRGWAPDRVLVSTARRSRETWHAMSENIRTASHTVLDGLYLATSEALVNIVSEAGGDARCLLVIGHNPGVHELACQMADQPGSDAASQQLLDAKMPTSAVAMYEIAETGLPLIQTCQLIEFLTPKSLRSS